MIMTLRKVWTVVQDCCDSECVDCIEVSDNTLHVTRSYIYSFSEKCFPSEFERGAHHGCSSHLTARCRCADGTGHQ